MKDLKIITAKIFTVVCKDGIICSFELYIFQNGTCGWRGFNSLGKFIDYELGPATESQMWEERMKKNIRASKNVKSWREIK